MVCLLGVIGVSCQPTTNESTAEAIQQDSKTTFAGLNQDSIPSGTINNKSTTDDVAPWEEAHARWSKGKGDHWQISVELMEAGGLTEFYGPDDLRLMRNEVFARHQYRFKDTELLNHFKKFDWYHPMYHNVDDSLTAVEKQNLQIIKTAEQEFLLASRMSRKDLFKEFLSIVPENAFPFTINDYSKKGPKMQYAKSSRYEGMVPRGTATSVVARLADSVGFYRILVYETCLAPPSWCYEAYFINTYDKEGHKKGNQLVAFSDIGVFQTAKVYRDSIRTYAHECDMLEEEGPSGLPEADTCYVVREEQIQLR